MVKFEDVYAWNVISEIKAGNTVYVLDKKEHECITVNDLIVSDFFAFVYENKDERFYFYKEVEVDEEVKVDD